MRELGGPQLPQSFHVRPLRSGPAIRVGRVRAPPPSIGRKGGRGISHGRRSRGRAKVSSLWHPVCVLFILLVKMMVFGKYFLQLRHSTVRSACRARAPRTQSGQFRPPKIPVFQYNWWRSLFGRTPLWNSQDLGGPEAIKSSSFSSLIAIL